MSDLLTLTIDRAVAGGRTLARSPDGVVLVAGAIPGERVRARIERVTRQVRWAEVVDVLEPSPDRREPPCDPMCGGLAYAHVAYQRQLALKAEVIEDAFRRVGRLALPNAVRVHPSPEQGYRLRARLHVRDGRAGLFRERTHDLCDAAATGQLGVDAIDAIGRTIAWLGPAGVSCGSVVIAEDVLATTRCVHLEPVDGRAIDVTALARPLPDGVDGLSVRTPVSIDHVAGVERVADTAAALFAEPLPAGVPADLVWQRNATSFFQANRFLVGALVRHVLERVQGDRIADLYAGVGLFAVPAAARGAAVLAVEGDRSSAADLRLNATPWPSIEALRGAVEHVLPRLRAGAFDTVVVDPPRTGLSAEAAAGVLRLGAPRIVYVSCDPATLARDAAKLSGAGYALRDVTAFDLFPNTAHVETLVTFEQTTPA